ncbi:MAG: hypothetical protein QM541_04810 [Flavobacterium sp.]|nr:hypothetical protein [Flavobacterium sp.]
MTTLNKTDISITEIVYDLMMINVNRASLLKNCITYVIRNQANKLIRKGNFSGYNVQLRMTHLEDGRYEFDLFIEDQLCLNIPFEKRTLGKSYIAFN